MTATSRSELRLELERSTLGLINMVAFETSSRRHFRAFEAATGVALATSDIRFIECLSGRDPMPVSQVARGLGVDLSQASRQTRNLADAGYLLRRDDPADRRRTLVELSDDGVALLDRWLQTWATDYQHASDGWSEADGVDLDRWFTCVRDALVHALPDRPVSAVAERWLTIHPSGELPAWRRSLTASVVGLVSWVGQSDGFDELLESHHAPIRQQAFFTLRLVSRKGPLSVAEVAEALGIDHSQASKRLTQLTDLGLVDRAVDAFDRRSSLVRVSKRGAALEGRIRDTQLNDFHSILPAVSAADRDRWTELTQRYVAQLFGAADARPSFE